MADLWSGFRGIFSGFNTSFLIWIGVGLAALIIGILIIVMIVNKKRFIHPVRIFRVRENGKYLERNVKGGYVARKGSSPFFRIKMGRWWWQYKDLITTPDLRYMDEENRVYYRQDDVDTFVQVKRTFDRLGNVDYSPVESDAKYGAILSINRIRQLTGGSDKWKTLAAIGGMVLVFALGIVGWALMMNAKCPTLPG